MEKEAECILGYRKVSNKAIPPDRSTPGSVGLDLKSPECYEIPARSNLTIPIELAFQMPDGHYGQIISRSNLAANFGIVVEAGVIDPDYTGNVVVVLHNHGDKPYEVQAGEQIAQMVLLRTSIPRMKEVAEMPFTHRGINAFGSTERRETLV